MKQALTRLKKNLPGYNRRIVDEARFWDIVQREKIHVNFWRLQDSASGFYGVNRRFKRIHRYIVINSNLLPNSWLPTALHELVHHFLHVPTGNLHVYFSKGGDQSRQDRQADTLALLMRLPKPLFFELARTPFDEIHDFTREELVARQRFFEMYGE